MSKYVLSVDQSTQGTKALLFDEKGKLLQRADLPHRQIINETGWVSHDPEEIFANVLKTARLVTEKAGIDPNEIACMGISNQRETSVAWNRETGKPVCDAIVWQCARATGVCAEVEATGIGDLVKTHTGLPISPYFPAAKLAWILRNVPEAKTLAERHQLCMGTVDAWLVYQLTGQYRTDYSNASRTQLFNLRELKWDAEICQAFGINAADLPEVTDSDAVFGRTNLGGLLDYEIPVCGVLGDSHAALFGQGCLRPGMVKATYGTGSSIMMNVGTDPIFSDAGVVTSLAWKIGGQVNYVLEGNINYTGAVITWLKDDMKLITSAGETEGLARQANPADTTYLVPAFSGLGAPYWDSEAKAAIVGMTRTTGRNELVRAALDCIAYQITDIVEAMGRSVPAPIQELRVDGGPTRNQYLMQFQSDLLRIPVRIPDAEELSGIGAAYAAGLSAGLYDVKVFDQLSRTTFEAKMDAEERNAKYAGWQDAVAMIRK